MEVDYQPLPAVASIAQAVAPGAPLVWDQAKGNTCFDWHLGDKAATDAAFAKAHKVVSSTPSTTGWCPTPSSRAAAIGEFDRATGDTTLYTTSQNPHLTRLLLGAFSYGIPEHKLRVVAPDVGGGFGSKIFHYAEEFLVVWAARKLGRPVKWTATRSEAFMSDAHGRDHVTHAELAVDKDGTFLGLRVKTAGQPGRLPLHLRPGRAHLALRHAAGRLLPHPGHLRRGARRLHQHRAGGRLPRRRPARGGLPHRAHRRRGGARARHRPRRAAAQELHPRQTSSPTRRRWRCSTTAATTSPRWSRR